ncbi:hypothetical protein RB195_023865 [Necator americanus]|uniref:Protein kinase domain-containing protein n=1 Tax=Necator americanus TaxID=51031 RepID=A0ABR1EN85_NECAM
MSLGFGDIQEGNNLPCRRGYSVDMLYQELMVSSGLLTIGGKTRRVAVEDLHFVAELGQGSCGHVSKMQYNDNVMAVKVMPRSNNPVENNRIIMDLRILSRAYDCPHIVHSYGSRRASLPTHLSARRILYTIVMFKMLKVPSIPMKTRFAA